MRTSKPMSTISYNSESFLRSKLEELVRNHMISDYLFIYHHAEADEKKDHIHLWIKPNTLLDSMDIQAFMSEYDPSRPDKPLGCIDFRLTKDVDDWILYNLHNEAYLASKGESREYHYLKEDIRFHDEDSFDDMYNHAFKGSSWAQKRQLLEMINNPQINPAEMILSGFIPLTMANSLRAFQSLQDRYSLNRGGRPNHEQNEFVESAPPADIEHWEDTHEPVKFDPVTGEVLVWKLKDIPPKEVKK